MRKCTKYWVRNDYILLDYLCMIIYWCSAHNLHITLTNVFSGEVYKDMLDVFDNDVFHMGGDEVNVKCWNSSSTITQYLTNHGKDLSQESFVELWGQFQIRGRFLICMHTYIHWIVNGCCRVDNHCKEKCHDLVCICNFQHWNCSRPVPRMQIWRP